MRAAAAANTQMMMTVSKIIPLGKRKEGKKRGKEGMEERERKNKNEKRK